LCARSEVGTETLNTV